MGNLLSKLWHSLVGEKEVRILMVGLDNAGKTTILYKLKMGEVVNTIPTVGFNVETVSYKNVQLTVWDIGGQHIIRPLWRHYFAGSHGIIFVVDSSDRNRISEARAELHSLLGEEELSDAAVLVFANKQDLPNAVPVAELTEGLGLLRLPRRKWFVQGCCAKNGTGMFEGLEWLTDLLKQ